MSFAVSLSIRTRLALVLFCHPGKLTFVKLFLLLFDNSDSFIYIFEYYCFVKKTYLCFGMTNKRVDLLI